MAVFCNTHSLNYHPHQQLHIPKTCNKKITLSPKSLRTRPLLKTPLHCTIYTVSSTSKDEKAIQTKHLKDLLNNEYGFSEEQQSYILEVTKHMSKSRHKAEEVLSVLKEYGYTKNQIKKIVNKNPSVLSVRARGSLTTKIEFFKNYGLLKSLVKSPRLLNSSIEKTLVPKMDFLRQICKNEDALIKLLKLSPDILLMDVENRLKPLMELLENHGIGGELARKIVSICPKILPKEEVEVVQNLEFLSSVGMFEGSDAYPFAVKAVTEIGVHGIREKIQGFIGLGLSEDEVVALFKMQPMIFVDCSLDKIEKIVGFVVEILGLPPNHVLVDYFLFSFGIDSRILPRHRVLKRIGVMQPLRELPRLGSVCFLKDGVFLEKYVYSSPDAEQLLMVYKGEVVEC